MRPLSGLAYVLLGLALWAPGCAKLNCFKRNECSAELTKGPRVGTPAPELAANDFDGAPFKLSDYRGKVVVFDILGKLVQAVPELIPHERELLERFRAQPFVVLGANYDADADAARKVIASHGITWRNWQTGGAGSPVDRVWQVEALPTAYVIDVNGVIRCKSVYGPHLKDAVETLLAEAEAKRQG